MSFSTNGLDSLILDMEEIAEIPDSTMDEMLSAGGEIVKQAHTEALRSKFARHTGHLAESSTVRIKNGRGGHYALIYPAGEHHTYRPVTGSGTASNAEVGFVLEFGGHGNAPSQWMREANEKAADEAVDAEFKVFDSWQKSHNL